MKEIPIGNILRIQVSDEDFEYLSQFKWYINNAGYIQTNISRKTILMHRMIVLDLMKLEIPEGKEIDHIDCNKLNNQRENLRVVTKSQNCLNKRKRIKIIP